MSLSDFFVFLSVSFTPMTIVVSVGVLTIWGATALKALLVRNKTETNWLAIGVALSFSCDIVEYAYWGVFWAARFIGVDTWFDMVSHGAAVNLVVKQGAAIAAGLCHIRGGILAKKVAHKVLFYGSGLTLITAGFLYYSTY